MRYPIKAALLCTALACALGSSGSGASTRRACSEPGGKHVEVKPVANSCGYRCDHARTQARRLADVPRQLCGLGYSQLDKINKTNVKNLQLVWSRAMAPGDNEITPIVYNGVMYIANPNDVIQAIDATSGDLLWEYKHRLPARESLAQPSGRT